MNEFLSEMWNECVLISRYLYVWTSIALRIWFVRFRFWLVKCFSSQPALELVRSFDFGDREIMALSLSTFTGVPSGCRPIDAAAARTSLLQVREGVLRCARLPVVSLAASSTNLSGLLDFTIHPKRGEVGVVTVGGYLGSLSDVVRPLINAYSLISVDAHKVHSARDVLKQLADLIDRVVRAIDEEEVGLLTTT